MRNSIQQTSFKLPLCAQELTKKKHEEAQVVYTLLGRYIKRFYKARREKGKRTINYMLIRKGSERWQEVEIRSAFYSMRNRPALKKKKKQGDWIWNAKFNSKRV